jgi:hypothetical protein
MEGFNMVYEIQHFTICDGWVNTWTIENEDGTTQLEYFDSIIDAQESLNEFLDEEYTTYVMGYTDSPFKEEEFRIVEVTQ